MNPNGITYGGNPCKKKGFRLFFIIVYLRQQAVLG
nr:MAG TPA: hypothetical protein [Caudoviricetes sp.]